MIQEILNYLRYELPANLFDKIQIGFVCIILIGCLILIITIEKRIQEQEKSIILLQHEIDSINLKIDKNIHKKCCNIDFSTENYIKFKKEN